MNTYKYETHFHTLETSNLCGKVKASEAVKLYRDAGFTGVAVTDHYNSTFFEMLPGISWNEKADLYLEGYRRAYEEGRRIGLDVHLGMEIRFDENCNEYLVYGFDEDFLKENKKLYGLGLREFRKLTFGTGIIIIQAHPCRRNMIAADPALVDGIEIFNGNPRHDSANHLAEKYARDHGLKMLSGSDFHQPVDTGRGGIIVKERIKKDGFTEVVKNNKILDFIRTVD